MATVDIYYKIENGVLSLRNNSASGYTLFSCPNNSGDDQQRFPWKWNGSITTITIDNNIVLPKSCYSLFSFNNSPNLTTINNISNLDTSNVINMKYMFDNCRALTSLDVSGFDTSNVTNMSYMFQNCQALTSLDTSNFNTSNVTNMEHMFYNCKALTSLDVSNFDTSKVTNMSFMFDDCLALTSLDVSGFNTSNVTDMGAMFSDCLALTSLDVSGFDTSKVTGMYSMFSNCRALTSLDVSDFDTSEVTNMYAMFNNCLALTSLDTSNFDASKATRVSYMFNNCWALTSLDLSDFDTSNVTDMDGMFRNCRALMTIIISSTLFKTTQVTSSSDMFSGCTNLVGGRGTSYDSSYIDKTYACADDAPTILGYFTGIANCASFDSTDGTLEIFYTGAVHTNGEVVGTKTYYTGIEQITGNTTPKWYSIRNSITKVIIEDLFKPKTGYYLFSSILLEEIEGIEYLNTSNVTSMYGMFCNCQALISLDLSDFDTSNVTDMGYMFEYCRTLTSLDLSNFDTSNVTSMNSMFSDCLALISLDLSDFDTSNVTHMYYMFNYCQALTSLDLSDFDTSNVTSMYGMFIHCHALTSLDLSDFDTSNVTDMAIMFSYCDSLTSLDLSNFDTSNVTTMNSMFNNCKALTTLDLSSFDTSNVTNMSGMFSFCYELKPLDLSNFNTLNVTNMNAMFSSCKALTTLDLSNFNTSKVTDMRSMFGSCILLTSLNISNFDTSNVTSMNNMFSYCYELEPLNVSNFNTSKVTNMANMFDNCSSLTSLNISNFVFSNNVNINSMFEGCTSLAGAIRINSNPGSYTDMFKNTVEEIVLLGNSTLLNSFATTANNHNVYVWTLTAQPTASRDNNVGTSANLSVKIESYAITNNNIIRAIKVYEGDSTNPLGLTWDKQFAIDENPKTFTTTITNIDENATVTYRIQVEDNYGVSAFREVIVPTNYYTIDFLKKGKEISFGVKADIDDFYEVLTTIPDDWASNYHNYYKKEGDEYISNTDVNFVSGNYYKKIHESLFKCGMDAVFLTETQLFKSMYDIMHPIGSYYESSLTYIPPSQMSQQTPDLDNPTSEDLKALGITWFNPNFIWSGRWELESGGRVHIGSGTNEANTTNNWGSYTAGQDTWIAGEKGGETKHLLDETQMPSHTHTQNSHNHSQYEHNHAQNSHSHTAHYTGVNRGGGSTATRVGPYSYTSYPNDHVQVGYTTATNIAATATNIATTATNNNTGGGQAHENMPPYIVVNRWHRVA